MQAAAPSPAEDNAKQADPPVIFLMGPTACGKTDLSLSLACELDAEIISVDSALVYRGMDIGTAKPSLQERQGVPHHLIDVCEPSEIYSAARFCADALDCIASIHRRGRRALMVGGTMLYFKALEEGLADLPDADPQLRARLQAEAERDGWPALHEQLRQVDPAAAARIHVNDPQRLQRALEVYRITGIAMSRLQAETTPMLAQPPRKFALIPEDRRWLHQRIEKRFAQMLDMGFFDEMQRLRSDPANHLQLPAMRSVGYRQAWEHLDAMAVDDPVPDRGQGDWVDAAVAATRQLAKRQLTWLRGMPGLTRIACDRLTVQAQQQIILSTLDAAD